MIRYFLGIDGGQSKTTALIGDQSGRVLGTGTSGPCNHVATGDGREKFVNAISGCLAAACRKAGLVPTELSFESACLGFSGGPEDKRALVRELINAEKLTVTTDAWIALSGATGGKPGIVALAGTGSIALGRDGAGRTARAGGWGYIFGDEGGAFDIVRQALRAWLRSEEGWGPPTALKRKLMEATGASSANELLHMFYSDAYPRDRVAGYATLVDEAVLEGDAVAHQIIAGAARHLAGLVTAVRDQLFAAGSQVLVSYTGGAFRNTLLGDMFRTQVEVDVDCRCAAPLHKPAVGALIEAWQAAGVRPGL
jgi:N-acetylglucosamine kinase-like BadF-type ATPase